MKIILATAAISLISFEALASDLPNAATASASNVATTPAWSGFYMGVFAGGSDAKTTVTDISGEQFGFNDLPNTELSSSDVGVFGGFTIGHNFQSGSVVLGPELEIGYLQNNKVTVTGDEDGRLTNHKGLFGFLGVRAGYLVTNQTLVFAKGGAVASRIRSAAGDWDEVGNEDNDGIWGFDGNETAGGVKTRLGYAVGGGVEQRINSSWSVKIEYLYKDFGTETYQTLVEDTQPFSFKDTVHTLKIGVNYRY